MPQEPKKRHSRQRQGKRRASIHLTLARTVTCLNCGADILTHQICPACGFYKGKQVVKKKDKNKDKDKEQKALPANAQEETK